MEVVQVEDVTCESAPLKAERVQGGAGVGAAGLHGASLSVGASACVSLSGAADTLLLVGAAGISTAGVRRRACKRMHRAFVSRASMGALAWTRRGSGRTDERSTEDWLNQTSENVT